MKTPDLYLSAFLKAKGYKLKMERNKGKCFFCFEDVADSVVEDYYNNEQVGALEFKDALCNLKSLIHNIGETHGNNK